MYFHTWLSVLSYVNWCLSLYELLEYDLFSLSLSVQLLEKNESKMFCGG